jgi:hypothetical protein
MKITAFNWIGNVIVLILFVWMLVATGLLGYLYLYDVDTSAVKEHKALKEEFKIYKDSMALEVEVLNYDKEVMHKKFLKAIKAGNKINNKLEISNATTQRIKDSIRVRAERRKLDLIKRDTITNEEADIWTVNKFG